MTRLGLLAKKQGGGERAEESGWKLGGGRVAVAVAWRLLCSTERGICEMPAEDTSRLPLG